MPPHTGQALAILLVADALPSAVQYLQEMQRVRKKDEFEEKRCDGLGFGHDIA
jgi:hypothetical protein